MRYNFVINEMLITLPYIHIHITNTYVKHKASCFLHFEPNSTALNDNAPTIATTVTEASQLNEKISKIINVATAKINFVQKC